MNYIDYQYWDTVIGVILKIYDQFIIERRDHVGICIMFNMQLL